MKKLLILLIIVLGSYSCTKETCKCKKDDLTQWKIVDFAVTRSMWELVGIPNDIGSYYYYVADVPELTNRIYNDGLFMCYYLFIDDSGYNVQTPLPFTNYDIILEDDREFPWSVHFSFDVMPGSIAFKIVFSDFYTDDWNPPARCDFRLVMIY